MISLLANGTAFWTTAAIGLAGLVAYQVTDEPPAGPDIDAVSTEMIADMGPQEAAAIVDLPSEDLVAEIAERPLFSPSRRPTPPEPATQPEADNRSNDKPTLELIGTMLAGDDQIALLKHPTDGLLRLRPGQKVGGWTIVDVQHQRVNMESEDGLEVLTLRKDRIGRPAQHSPKKNARAGGTNEESDEEEPETTSAPIRRPI